MFEEISVLLVDDEELNIDLMEEYCDGNNIKSFVAHDGLEALKVLEDNDNIDVIVLDRMMPNMNGIEFLEKVKKDGKYKNIPVIMQTAATASHQIAEGISAGVFYYLPKPYSREVFLSLIHSANDDFKKKSDILQKIAEYSKAMSMVMSAEFRFKTIEEAKVLAMLVGSALPNPDIMVIGLSELMLNSVEHGNLGITYDEKKELKQTGNWNAEIEKRLGLNENINKFCSIQIDRDDVNSEFFIHIKDQGEGFDWKKYTAFDPTRLMDPNGRGIMLSQNCGFNNIEYIGAGNEITFKVCYAE